MVLVLICDAISLQKLETGTTRWRRNFQQWKHHFGKINER